MQLTLSSPLKPGVKSRMKISWSSADKWCCNCIWVINKFIAHRGVAYIRGLTVPIFLAYKSLPSSSSSNLPNSCKIATDVLWVLFMGLCCELSPNYLMNGNAKSPVFGIIATINMKNILYGCIPSLLCKATSRNVIVITIFIMPFFTSGVIHNKSNITNNARCCSAGSHWLCLFVHTRITRSDDVNLERQRLSKWVAVWLWRKILMPKRRRCSRKSNNFNKKSNVHY